MEEEALATLNELGTLYAAASHLDRHLSDGPAASASWHLLCCQAVLPFGVRETLHALEGGWRMEMVVASSVRA
jgi:hypothetical protein